MNFKVDDTMPGYVNIYRFVAEKPAGAKPSEISTYTGVAKQTVFASLTKMIELGLITRVVRGKLGQEGLYRIDRKPPLRPEQVRSAHSDINKSKKVKAKAKTKTKAKPVPLTNGIDVELTFQTPYQVFSMRMDEAFDLYSTLHDMFDK